MRYDPEAVNFQPLTVQISVSGTQTYLYTSDQITPFTNRFWRVKVDDFSSEQCQHHDARSKPLLADDETTCVLPPGSLGTFF